MGEVAGFDWGGRTDFPLVDLDFLESPTAR